MQYHRFLNLKYEISFHRITILLISNFLWVWCKNHWNKNLSPRRRFNSNSMLQFFTKMRKMSDLDWTQHVKMHYTLNLRKNPVKAKIRPSQCFYMILLALFTVLQNQEFAAISWNLIKIAIFEKIMGIVNLEMIKNIWII